MTIRFPRRSRLASAAALLASILLFSSAVAAGGLPTEEHAPAATAPRPAILVFTRTLGWRHDSIPQAVETLRGLAAQAGFEVVHSEDPALFDNGQLARFRAVVFANTTGEVLDAAQRAAFERYIAAGGAFMGVHSAADTGKAWPWYGELVGAWFKDHPPGLQTTDVHFEDGRGPDGLERWRVTDELYNYRRNPRPAVVVIATVDESGYEGGTMGTDHPIAWCHAAAGGRAWYTGLGHAQAVYADPVFRAHLLRGLRYATGLSGDC
ncbi:ThuA domain-containing protein [Pseudoxanthomonas suwonensis]|uniref:ThuA domain-containing protein n=1 Tax=Pseudoxanthomonas suwonensis TaxID=314722 RepID=UPI0009E2F6DD|nr:ThuA domain-containing protein [Pseudoxanthomonas suwonensis]